MNFVCFVWLLYSRHRQFLSMPEGEFDVVSEYKQFIDMLHDFRGNLLVLRFPIARGLARKLTIMHILNSDKPQTPSKDMLCTPSKHTYFKSTRATHTNFKQLHVLHTPTSNKHTCYTHQLQTNTRATHTNF
jgi:hypothetical protein